MFEDLDLNQIQDGKIRDLIVRLLNQVEQLSSELREVRAENQSLRDEVNRLKGEQGKPKIKGNTPKPPPSDQSSEKERRTPRQRHKRSKKAEIVIHREQVVRIDPALLPEDVQFKGCEDVVVQDLVLRSENTLFHKQKYYAASTHKTYLAELPQGMKGSLDRGSKH